MGIAAIILSILLALISAGAGAPKAGLKGPATEQLTGRGLSANLVRFIGAAEVAGALGLLIGLAWHPLGILAAIGLVIVFIGAVVFHARFGDFSDAERRGGAVPSVVVALLSVVTLIVVIAA
ncbi:DoxX family protein [Williamsia deligens]|uniref:DoxX family protein n=1 Tax=Williamsia deligens TaxID=321325 RepID=A0ABW3G4I3_9NOCA|nr:DoxX family protein [Williamsia deligens]MCP2193714.1 DoxX-like family protein [Williamsia deligens]